MPRSLPRVLLVLVLGFTLVLIVAIAQPAQAAGSHLWLTHNIGSPSTHVNVGGKAFGRRQTISLSFDNISVGTVRTDGTGAFYTKITIPASALPGEHNIHALSNTGNLIASATFQVQTAWPMFGFNAQHTHFNPYENILNPSNVTNLQGGKIVYTGFYVHASPAVANGLVFLGAGFSISAYHICLCWASPVWTVSTGVYADDTSLVVMQGVVYAASTGGADSILSAFDATTGAILWTVPIGSNVYASPTVANGVVYVGTEGRYGGHIYAFNATTGSIVWSASLANINASSPAVANGVVYVGSEDHQIYAFNATTGAKLWMTMTGDGLYSSPTVVNGIVYIGSSDGKLYAFKVTTGALLWTYTTQAPIIYSSPAVANGVVYIGSLDDHLYALNARTGALLWNDATQGIITSSPTVANGVVYISSKDYHLYAFNAVTGAVLWRTYIESSESSPTVTNGMIFIGTSDDYLCLFTLPGMAPSGSRR